MSSALEELPTYVLRNTKGVEVHVRPLGALIQKLLVPDITGNGECEDVVLGFDELLPYKDGTSPYFGVVVGRVANRIKDGDLKVGDEAYQVSVNENGNTLHGGEVGFDKAVWDLVSYEDGKAVVLKHVSPDGDQGFPGEVTVTVEYRLTEPSDSDDGLLLVDMSAVTTKPTPISLAQHGYWNLNGHGNGSDVLNHNLHLNSGQYRAVDASLIPTGVLVPTPGTPFDFPEGGSLIGAKIAEVAGGYDHNFVLDPSVKRECGERLKVAESLHLTANFWTDKRKVELITNAPAVQFYSGGFLPFKEGATAKASAMYKKFGGLCLETGSGLHNNETDNFIIEPDTSYKHIMVYKFN